MTRSAVSLAVGIDAESAAAAYWMRCSSNVVSSNGDRSGVGSPSRPDRGPSRPRRGHGEQPLDGRDGLIQLTPLRSEVLDQCSGGGVGAPIDLRLLAATLGRRSHHAEGPILPPGAVRRGHRAAALGEGTPEWR
jgi:hypothetical protein